MSLMQAGLVIYVILSMVSLLLYMAVKSGNDGVKYPVLVVTEKSTGRQVVIGPVAQFLIWVVLWPICLYLLLED